VERINPYPLSMKTFLLPILFFFCSFLHAGEWVSYPIKGLTKPVSGVNFVAGRFVAWGEGFYVSQDGMHWREVMLPLNEMILSGVFHNGNEWVLFAHHRAGWSRSVRLSSNNLVDWKMVLLQAHYLGKSPVYAKGRFYDLLSTSCYRSLDGGNWQEIPLGIESSDDYLYGMSQLGDTLFLMALDRYWTSVDGVEWTLNPTPMITDASGDFVEVHELVEYKGWTFARSGRQLFRSQDRKQWTLLSPTGIHADLPLDGGSAVIQFFKTGHALYMVSDSGAVFFTYDGTHWGTAGRPAIPHMDSFPMLSSDHPLAVSGDTLVCVDGRDFHCKVGVADWVKRSDAGWSLDGDTPQWFAGRYFVGGTGAQLWSSAHGIWWRTDFKYAGFSDLSGMPYAPYAFSDVTLRLAQGNGTLLAMGYGDWVMLTRDGGAWDFHRTTLDGMPIAPLTSVGLDLWSNAMQTPVYQDGRWISTGGVYVGDYFDLVHFYWPISSVDGIHWVSDARAPDWAKVNRIERGNGCYVAQGEWLYYSCDGQHWSDVYVEGLDRECEAPSFFEGLMRFNGEFLVVKAGSVFRSVDGMNWTLLSVPVEGFIADNTITLIGEILYFRDRSEYRFVSMSPDGSFAIHAKLPLSAPVVVEGEAPLPIAMKGPNSGMVMLQQEDLPHPVVEITSLLDELWEGEGSRAVFSVVRHGDLTRTLKVVMGFVGDAVPGVDFLSNLERRGDQWVLRFEPGNPELHVRIETKSDGLDEGEETVALWIRNMHDYRVNPGLEAASVLLLDAADASGF
jgi:hypothetical protein